MIKLKRGNAYADKLRTYKIFIDDVYRGDIKQNETKEFDVDKGKHVIYAKIDWCRSGKLFFDDSGSITELEVGSTLTGSKKLFSNFMYITFLRNEYLWIKKCGCRTD